MNSGNQDDSRITQSNANTQDDKTLTEPPQPTNPAERSVGNATIKPAASINLIPDEPNSAESKPTTPTQSKETQDRQTTIPKRNIDFPFKPIDTPKNEPEIGVNFEKTEKKNEKIDLPDYDTLPSKKSSTPIDNKIISKMPAAKTGLSATAHILAALLFVSLGFGAGFGGYKYAPKITKLFTTSADTNANDDSTQADITQPKNAGELPGTIDLWPSYANTKYAYSIKYPDNWYGQNLSDPNSAKVLFSNLNLSSGTDTSSGYKVEIVAQPLENKTLSDWISANNTASGSANSGSLTPIKIAGSDAFQQTDTATSQSVTTYIASKNYVLQVIFSAPQANFASGQTIYNEMLNSIGF